MSNLETCSFDYIPHECGHIVPDDLTKLLELRATEARALSENDYFTVKRVRSEAVYAEREYHARLDRERTAEWGKMPPHP